MSLSSQIGLSYIPSNLRRSGRLEPSVDECFLGLQMRRCHAPSHYEITDQSTLPLPTAV